MINTINLPPFKKMCVTIGNLPSSFMESMTYYEALVWLYKYFEETLLPAINTNSEAITELQNAFELLKSYVDNYFENLDVQTEINNKLDEMAESGELENIIAQYIELQTTYTYNNVEEMQEATNLLNGSFVKTMGYYQYNDGGEAYYHVRNVTNEDVIDNMFIFALDDVSLVAELIVKNNKINIRQCGITGDPTEDITTKLTSILSKEVDIYFPNGTYVVSAPLSLNSHKLIGEDVNNVIIKYDDTETHNELINSHNINNLLIENMCFDCGSNTDITKTSINLYDTINLKIINCEFKNGYGSHLRLNGSDSILIDNCYFHDITGTTGNMGNAIYCHPVKNMTVKNCKCDKIMEDFIYLDGDPSDPIIHVTIENNYIYRTGYENSLTSSNGIGINGDCQKVIIQNNIIKNNINGIKTSDRYDTYPSDISILSNVIDNNSQNGISISSYNTFVTGNRISNNTQDGIYSKNSDNIFINDNIVYNSNRNGMLINTSTNINIDNCILFDNRSVGIASGTNAGNACSNINISNCTLYKTDTGTQTTGIQILYGDNIKVLSCKCFNHVVDYDINRNTTNFISQLNPIFAKSVIKSLMYSNAIPLSGTYNVGDIVLYTSPTAGGYIGAVCTVAGTPGTWKQFGSISN